MAIDLTRTFVNSLALPLYLDGENEWHQGTDTVAASWEQAGMMGLLIEQGSSCLKNWRWGALSSTCPKLSVLIKYFPFIIAIATERVSKEKYPMVHFIGKTISYNTGKCLKVAYAIVTLNAISYNPTLVVISSMGYFSAYLLSSPKIPYDVRETAKKIISLLEDVSLAIYSPVKFTRGVALLSLVIKVFSEFNFSYISDLFFGKFSVEVEKEDSKVSLKTLSHTRTAVNPRHFRRSYFESNLDQISPQEMKRIIDQFRSALDSIDFGAHEDSIKAHVATDDHFNSAEWTNEDLKEGREIDFMKEGARIFLYRLEKAYADLVSYPQKPRSPLDSLNVRKRSISNIKIEKKEHLAHLLLWLQEVYQKTEGMSPAERQEQRGLFLMNVGIHGSNYCIARLLDLPRTLRGFSNPQDQVLESSLFSLLRDKQEEFVKSSMKLYLNETRLLSRMVGSQEMIAQSEGDGTPHQFNKFLYLFGQVIGLNYDLALADHTLSPSVIKAERCSQFLLIRQINRDFYQRFYTEYQIINWVRHAIMDSGRINAPKFIEWCQQQEGYVAELAIDDYGNPTDEAIRYFLLKHGVLGVIKRDPRSLIQRAQF